MVVGLTRLRLRLRGGKDLLDATDSTVCEFHLDPSRVVVAGEELRDGALDLTTSLLICFQYY